MAQAPDVAVRRLPLVGRTAERERARRAMTRAATGAGRALLFTGEPGIGKSALLAEIQADARSAGFLVVAGLVGRLPRPPA